LRLLLDMEQKKEGEMLSLPASGACSSSLSTVTDSCMSQPLNSIVLLQNFCERSSAEQYLHSSTNVTAVSELEFALPSGIHEWAQLTAVSGGSGGNHEPSLLARNVSDDGLNRNKALLEIEHYETLDREEEWMMNEQSLAMNPNLHTSSDSIIDTSSAITDSGVDSSTVSSCLCINAVSAAELDSCALQEIAVGAKKSLHGRSASESGTFKTNQCFQNLPQHVCVHGKYEPGIQ